MIISNLIFEPWVGDNYKNTNPKIIILGKSAYSHKEVKDIEALNKECRGINISIIENNAKGYSGKSSVALYRQAALIANSNYHDSNNKAIWDNVIFTNFYQGFIGNGHHHDKRYLNEDGLKNSKEVLFDILEEHKPDLVIAWGRNNLRGWLKNNEKVIVRDEVNFLWSYEQYPKTLIWNIYHPAYRFFAGAYFKKANEYYQNVILTKYLQ